MTNQRRTPTDLEYEPGLLARAVRGAARGAARRPRLTVALWLVLIVACVAGGSLAGTRTLSNAGSGTGESARADARLTAAGLQPPAVESVLIGSSDRARTRAAVRALETRARALRSVRSVRGPADTPALMIAGGRTALVQVQLRGDPANAAGRVAPLQEAVGTVARQHPGVTFQQAGGGSVVHAINQIVAQDLQHAELISLPITLLVLVLAFGALVAASVPLLLGLSSVGAALGALGLVSQIAPNGSSTAPVVVLIGLAVGVDYSLFYIRREREERRAGLGRQAALEATAATVGRAVLIAGLTVMVALAGLLFTGLGVFTSMALGAIVVVMISVIGSVTVLPAVLALLGDRIDRGRLLGRFSSRGSGGWSRLAEAVTGHPRAALSCSVFLLGALTVPIAAMHIANPGDSDLPPKTPVLVAERAIERTFPGSPVTADVVVTGHGLASAQASAGLRALGRRAVTITGGRGAVNLSVAGNGETALVSVPMPDHGLLAARRTVDTLRRQVDPTAVLVAPGAHAQLTGLAAGNLDFTDHMSSVTPPVIAFVLALAFVLLVGAFRSPLLAGSVIALNLLSVGASFGILVAIFQHHWAQSLLGFTSNGAIVNWLPLFAFVVLFGLSMDYTVLMLERVREARRAGASARSAARQAVASTAGTVTSAAMVMVGVFAIFATLRLLEFKQLGIGLAAAIALDATIVRGVALPAALTLLGDRVMSNRELPLAATPDQAGEQHRRVGDGGWNHKARIVILESSHD